MEFPRPDGRDLKFGVGGPAAHIRMVGTLSAAEDRLLTALTPKVSTQDFGLFASLTYEH